MFYFLHMSSGNWRNPLLNICFLHNSKKKCKTLNEYRIYQVAFKLSIYQQCVSSIHLKFKGYKSWICKNQIENIFLCYVTLRSAKINEIFFFFNICWLISYPHFYFLLMYSIESSYTLHCPKDTSYKTYFMHFSSWNKFAKSVS